jgi:anion-transporting  ArsA/GET3 family ATPase
VTTAEEMPVNETLELVRRVSDETAVDVAAVVVNRVLPELFIRSDEEVFEQLREPALLGRLEATAGDGLAPVLEAARLALRLRRSGAAHVERLRSELATSLPLLYVPYLFSGAGDRKATEAVAEALASELGG